MTHLKRAIIKAIILCAAIYLANTSSVSAQGQSLSIYPPVIEIQATPPSSPVVKLVIQNNNSEDVALKIELIPLKPNGTTGDVTLMPSLSDKGFYPYYKDKIQFLVDNKKTDTITLQALETREIDLNVNLEKGDPPGDFYYSIVFISSGSQPQDTSVSSIPAGIATNLLLSIGPKSQASGGIAEFTTKGFKSNGPADFYLKLHNASSHLIQPQGTVEIYDIFGRKVGKVTVLPQYILANSDRYLMDQAQATGEARLAFNESTNKPKIVWPEEFLLGLYKAKANIILEENGKKIEAVTYFFAFPTYLFFALTIVLFVIISIYLRVKKKV